ncbi:hypothetical protein F6455_01400 [Proteobacteria bacterium 005FR1]|nr:hypothetical protein [Proteobacteria bacterium 005FR1]
MASTEKISEDLHNSGVSDWYIHIICKDEAGLCQKQLHSSNYFETLDVLRRGLFGAACGLGAGLIAAGILSVVNPFGIEMPFLAFAAVVFLLTCFGAWQGGLLGIGEENKKIARFHDDIEAGKHLILIYAPKNKEKDVANTMNRLHPEARLVAVDPQFFNPFAVPARQPLKAK